MTPMQIFVAGLVAGMILTIVAWTALGFGILWIACRNAQPMPESEAQ